MPFVEITTSQQNASQDSEGYMRVVRTFRVWGVTPATFWLAKTSIPHRDANAATPVGDKIPDYGDKIASTRNPFQTGNDGGGILTDVLLYDYQMRPRSAVTFDVDAIYTNDPRAAPLGQHYTSTQQMTFVPVPYVRELFVIGSGTSSANGGSPISYEEVVYQAPMQMERISHSVSIRRSLLKDVEKAIEQQAGSLHKLPVKQYACKFEGGDITMRGPQWLDVRYHWTYESGVQAYASSTQGIQWGKGFAEDGAPAGADLTLHVPPNIESTDASIGTGSTKFLVPPYHTIDLGWTAQGSDIVRSPFWIYRVPLRLGSGSFNPTWQGLPGSNSFVWGP